MSIIWKLVSLGSLVPFSCCGVFQFAIVLYNPFGRNVSMWIRLPVSGNSYAVSDYQLRSVASQVWSSLICLSLWVDTGLFLCCVIFVSETWSVKLEFARNEMRVLRRMCGFNLNKRMNKVRSNLAIASIAANLGFRSSISPLPMGGPGPI